MMGRRGLGQLDLVSPRDAYDDQYPPRRNSRRSLRRGNSMRSGYDSDGDGAASRLNSPWTSRLVVLLMVGVCLGGLRSAAVLMEGGGGAGYTHDRYNEILIPKDARTKRYGFAYSETLTILAVDEASPAHEVGLNEFVGRRIRKVNGIPVYTAGDLQRVVVGRDVRTSLSHHIILSVSPPYGVGAAVRAVRRLAFRAGMSIPQGTVGVITRVPGVVANSPCQVLLGGVRFDASHDQVELVVEEDLVPRRYDKSPGWIVNTAEDVKELITSLGLTQYLAKMLDYGLDRMDLLAEATAADAAELGIRPLHWDKMQSTARQVVHGRRRADRQHVGDKLLVKELRDLSERAAELRRNPRLKPVEVEAATIDLNSTNLNASAAPDAAVALGGTGGPTPHTATSMPAAAR